MRVSPVVDFKGLNHGLYASRGWVMMDYMYHMNSTTYCAILNILGSTKYQMMPRLTAADYSKMPYKHARPIREQEDCVPSRNRFIAQAFYLQSTHAHKQTVSK